MSRLYSVYGHIDNISEEESGAIARLCEGLDFDFDSGTAYIYGEWSKPFTSSEAQMAESVAEAVFAVTARYVPVFLELADIEDLSHMDVATETGYLFDERDFERLYAHWCASQITCQING